MADDELTIFDMPLTEDDPTMESDATYVPGLASYKASAVDEDGNLMDDEAGLLAGVMADADITEPCIIGGVVHLPLASSVNAGSGTDSITEGGDSSSVEAGLMRGVKFVSSSYIEEELPHIKGGVLYIPFAECGSSEVDGIADAALPGVIRSVVDMNEEGSAVTSIRDGVLYLRQRGGLRGVSVVTYSTETKPEVKDRTLYLPLANYGDSSVENAVGVLSAVEVVNPYGADAGGARAPELRNGSLRIPRAHCTGSGVDQYSPGLLERVVSTDQTTPTIENGTLRLPRGVTAVYNQKESSYTEPTIFESNLINPYAHTASGVEGAVGLISAIEYASSVDGSGVENLPRIEHGTIILPRGGYLQGLAHGGEDADGWRHEETPWSGTDGLYIEAASFTTYLGPMIGSLTFFLDVGTQDGYLKFRLRGEPA